VRDQYRHRRSCLIYPEGVHLTRRYTSLRSPTFYHENKEDLISNLVNGAVVLSRLHIDAVEFSLRLHLVHSMRTRIVFELFYVGEDLSADVRVQSLQVPDGGGRKFQGV